MATYIGGDPENKKLSGLLKDLLDKLIANVIPLESIVRFLKFSKEQHLLLVEGKNPFTKLRYLGNTTLPEMTERFDPHEFFKTRPGLYVWPDFAEILAVAKPVNAASDLIIGKFCLEDTANDAEIRAELPEDHVFEDASTFCVYLAGMIERQWGGTAGDLLNNGYANLFYVRGVDGEVFEVGVVWDSDSRKWLVRARSLGDALWDAGSRAFSATAGALEAQAA